MTQTLCDWVNKQSTAVLKGIILHGPILNDVVCQFDFTWGACRDWSDEVKVKLKMWVNTHNPSSIFLTDTSYVGKNDQVMFVGETELDVTHPLQSPQTEPPKKVVFEKPAWNGIGKWAYPDLPSGDWHPEYRAKLEQLNEIFNAGKLVRVTIEVVE